MIRFVSIVSPDFWPGFAALVQSLSENAGLGLDEYAIDVICDPEQAPRAWLNSRPETISLLPNSAIPEIAILSRQKQGRRMEQAMRKLGVFALPESGGPRTYIDSDMICLGSLRKLAGLPPLAAACEELCGFDTGRSPASMEGVEINTGLMVFTPSQKAFAELESIYARRHGERCFKGDQDIINMWLQETGRPVHRLGSEWNLSKRFQDRTGAPWIKDRVRQVKVLHFVGVKPWTPNSQVTTFRECHYGWMEKIWWDYFERSGFASRVEMPLQRSAAFIRQWVVPWTRPAILREHAQRACRLVRKAVSRAKPVRLSSGG
jgi:hypothetical protein